MPNRFEGTMITLGDGSVVPYDAIVAQILSRYQNDQKNPSLAVKSAIQLGIPEEVYATFPGVNATAIAEGQQMISSGAFSSSASNSAADAVEAAPVGSAMHNSRIAAGLDAYGYPPEQVAALRAAGNYKEPPGATPAPPAQQYTDQQIKDAIVASRQQGFNDQQIIQGAQANFGLTADRINALIKTVPAQAAAPAAGLLSGAGAPAAAAAQGPAVKDAAGNIIGYQSSEGTPGAVRVQTGANRNGPIYSYVTPPTGQYTSQVQTGVDRAGNAIYGDQTIITPQAQQAQGQAAASTFTTPSWVANAKQTIGTGVEPVYPTRTGRDGTAVQDTSQAPIGYRYDNGQSQYVYLDLAGKPTGTVENRGSGIFSQITDMAKTVAPLALAALGANYLPGLLGGAAGGTGASIGEMVASGLAPGSVGAAGAASGLLTGDALAAAAGLSGTAATTLASTLGTITPATSNLTPAALESLAGTAGYGTNASAINAAIQAGINPAIVGSGAAGTVANLLTGTSGAVTTAANPLSLNEAVAAGGGPSAVNTAATQTGLLTGNTAALNTLAGTNAVTQAALNEAVAAGTFTPGNLAQVAASNGITTAELISTLVANPEALAAATGTTGLLTGATSATTLAAQKAAADAADAATALEKATADKIAADAAAKTAAEQAAADLAARDAAATAAEQAAANQAAANSAAIAQAAAEEAAKATAAEIAAKAAAATTAAAATVSSVAPAAAAALTPAAIEAGLGTAGYGTSAAALNATNAAGNALFNPATVGAGAGIGSLAIPAGTVGLNQAVAAGTAPSAVNAAATEAGILTGNTAAANAAAGIAGGSSIADMIKAAMSGITPTDTAGIIKAAMTGAAGLMQGQSASDAAKTQADAITKAAQIAADAAKFKPVGVTTAFGSSNFGFDANGNLISAGYKLTPELAAQRDAIMKAAGTTGMDWMKNTQTAGQGLFNLGQGYVAKTPEQAAAEWMAAQQKVLQPAQDTAYARMQQQLANTGRGGLSIAQGTGMGAANPEAQAYYNALMQQNNQLAASAQAEGRAATTFGQGLMTGGLDLVSQGYNPYKTQFGTAQSVEQAGQNALDIGSALGGRAATAGANAGSTLYQGGVGAAGVAAKANAQNPYADLLAGAAGNPTITDYLNKWISGV